MPALPPISHCPNADTAATRKNPSHKALSIQSLPQDAAMIAAAGQTTNPAACKA
jgi:hypothetical protein